jgi:hypothetical protein
VLLVCWGIGVLYSEYVLGCAKSASLATTK